MLRTERSFMGKFIALSAGLLVSVLGSAFTGLALGVWVFQDTKSVTLYGLTLLINFLPGILAGPVAGALVDRWNRRAILMITDAASAATILGLALLFEAGVLRTWHIVIAVGIQSVLRSLQLPALGSVVVLLAPKEQVGRANGLIMLSQALGNTVGFAAGGVLLLAVGLDGVLLVDCATFLVNVAVLLFVQIPRPPRSEAGSVAAGAGLLAEIRQGWRVLGTRRALIALLLFSTALNVSLGYADALLTPLVLTFASAAALGVVVASLGVGAVLGSATLATWGGPRRRINGLVGFALPLGFFLCLGAFRPSVPLIVIAALGFMFCFTVMDGTVRNILQLEVEPDLQGRVFSAYNIVAGAVLCSSYALAGPLADHYFEPLLRVGGPLADTVGSVMGVGPGRGMALLMLVVGLVMLLTAVTAYLQPSLRSLADRPTGDRAAAPEAEVAPLPVPAEAMVVPTGKRASGAA